MRKLLLLNLITIIVVTLTACSVIEKPESFTTAVTSSKKNTSYDAKATASLPQPVEIQLESDSGETEAFSYDIKYPVISNLQNENSIGFYIVNGTGENLNRDIESLLR